jgi:tetratricopeptide (TPR) repeat protein
MPTITEKELSPNAKSLWLKATSAVEVRNFGYAISLLQAVLKESPEFLQGRQWLRRSELAVTKSNKSFLKGISGASLQAMKAQSLIKKDPQAAILAAEEILEKDPYNSAANGLLRDAAAAAGMMETVGFALETMRDGNPKDTKVMHELARHYMANGKMEEAIKVYNQITAINPADMEAVKGGKDAAARASMKSGGWETAKDYRDVLKNKDESIALEQNARVVKSEDMINNQLAELYAQYEENNENLDVVRKIASLNEQKEAFEEALTWYKWAVDVSKGGDPNLVRKVSDLTLKNIDIQVSTRERWLQEQAELRNGEEPDEETKMTIAAYEADIATYKKQKAEMQIEVARKRVDRNPTDLNFRYELGEQLVRIEQYSEAIVELQKARVSPNLGVKAMNLLGTCFEAKNILNLAVKQYEDARAKLPNMDALRKEITYKLGLVYLKMGEKDKYIACMTEIYEVDSGYMDVAPRVEGSYGEQT